MSNAPTKRLIDYVPQWLPVAIALLGFIAFTVRADTEIKSLREDVSKYESQTANYTDRMARIETKIDHQNASLQRIERLLDNAR